MGRRLEILRREAEKQRLTAAANDKAYQIAKAEFNATMSPPHTREVEKLVYDPVTKMVKPVFKQAKSKRTRVAIWKKDPPPKPGVYIASYSRSADVKRFWDGSFWSQSWTAEAYAEKYSKLREGYAVEWLCFVRDTV